MNSKKILKIIGAIVVVLILAYSFMPSVWITYEQKIINHRAELNEFMKDDPESPLPDSTRTSFRTLDFYPPNPDFKVEASLEILEDKQIIRMGTSDGKTREYLRFAYASFELAGSQNRVTLLRPMDEKSNDALFLPFNDLTNGEETYGGGRYLDLEIPDNNKLTIDFNLAYNPYCVYSNDYSCPLPPAENRLAISVTAGEKIF